MPTHTLSHDVTVNFRGYPVHAKAGTKLTMIPDGMGRPCYAIPPHACDAGAMGRHDRWSIFQHDSTYFHVWAPADAVETIN